MARRKAKKRDYKLIGFKAYTDADADLLVHPGLVRSIGSDFIAGDGPFQ